MDDDKKKKPILVGGKTYEPNPSVMDRLKEGFESTDTRAQLEAVRRRRQKMGG